MKTYVEQKLFRKYWGWFLDPYDVEGVDIANFFSYKKVELSGFERTESLTSVIDLSRDINDIWKGARKNFIQKQIEQGRRRGVCVEKGGDFFKFYRLYTDFCHRMKFGRVLSSSLQKYGILFTAMYQGVLVGGGVFIGDGEYLRAWVLASARLEGEGRMREVIGAANRLVIWDALVWAKENGYKTFDLGGISPNHPNIGWSNVAVFKEGFGGERRMSYYYRKIYSPLLFFWMKIRRFISL